MHDGWKNGVNIDSGATGYKSRCFSVSHNHSLTFSLSVSLSLDYQVSSFRGDWKLNFLGCDKDARIFGVTTISKPDRGRATGYESRASTNEALSNDPTLD